jgi:hypothetical protein
MLNGRTPCQPSGFEWIAEQNPGLCHKSWRQVAVEAGAIVANDILDRAKRRRLRGISWSGRDSATGIELDVPRHKARVYPFRIAVLDNSFTVRLFAQRVRHVASAIHRGGVPDAALSVSEHQKWIAKSAGFVYSDFRFSRRSLASWQASARSASTISCAPSFRAALGVRTVSRCSGSSALGLVHTHTVSGSCGCTTRIKT